MCITFYPKSIIFLLILFMALFGSQMYKNVYMIKYIYFHLQASSGLQSQFERYLLTLGL